MLQNTFDLCLLQEFLLPVELRLLCSLYAWRRITNDCVLRDAIFHHQYSSIQFGPIEWWDTSEVQFMDGIFYNHMYFNKDISN